MIWQRKTVFASGRKALALQPQRDFPCRKNSVIACKEIGIDLSGKASTAVADAGIEKYEKFYCMSQSHAKMLMQFFLVQPEKIAVLGISDPYGGDIEVYRHCRDEIVNSVKEILKAYEN